MTRYVKTDYAGCEYLPAGVVFETARWDGDDFIIENPDGETDYCCLRECPHLHGHDWIECTADGTPIDGDGVARDTRSVSSQAAGREISTLMYQATELLDDLIIEACEQGYVPSDRVTQMSQEFRQSIQRYACRLDRSESARTALTKARELLK